jgi:hypothetical protein
MPKLEEKIAAAELKLKQMKTQQRQAEARKRSLAARNQRGQELRRKILAGAIVLAKVESGELDRGQFRHWLDQGLTRIDDRELFELPIRDAE